MSKCDVLCPCLCHDTEGMEFDHLPDIKGCPGKHGYVMTNDGQWVKEQS